MTIQGSAWALLSDRGGGEKTSAFGDLRAVFLLLRQFPASAYSQVLFTILICLLPIAALLPPVLTGYIIDSITRHGSLRLLIGLALCLLSLALVQGGGRIALSHATNRIAGEVTRGLSVEYFRRSLAQPPAYFSFVKAGAIQTRASADLRQIEQFLFNVWPTILTNFLTAVYTLVLVFVISPLIGAGALLLIPVFLVPGSLISSRIRRDAGKLVDTEQGLNSLLAERLSQSGSSLVNLYGSPELEAARFAKLVAENRRLQQSVSIRQQVFVQTLLVVAALGSGIVFVVGGFQTLQGSLSPGNVVSLAALLAALYPPIIGLAANQSDIAKVAVNARRIGKVLALRTSKDGTKVLESRGSAVSVSLDDVYFSYPTVADLGIEGLVDLSSSTSANSFGLAGVSVEIRAGQTVALVGPSGGGKSTIASLIAGVYEPNRGSVRLDGVCLSELKRDCVRSAVGLVLQESFLFNDTLRNNLRIAAPGAGDDDLYRALESAHLGSLLARLPDGLDTPVGERGVRFSGGERQRIALARLLLKNPSVVVLDEATASLDNESEAAVQLALQTVLRGRTVVVIAHRLSTVRSAEKILFVADGRVVEEGTHDELFAKRGAYWRLATAND